MKGIYMPSYHARVRNDTEQVSVTEAQRGKEQVN